MLNHPLNKHWLTAIVLSLLVLDCTPTKDDSTQATIKGDGSGLPIIHWKVELAGKGVRDPLEFDEDDFVRLFNDGRIVTSMENHTVAVRSASGEWKVINAPLSPEPGKLTWYENEENLGGYTSTNAHAFAVINGVMHKVYGALGKIRGWLPDSSLLLDAEASGYRFYLKWKFGASLVDSLDIHNYFYEDYSKGRMFYRLSQDGTFMLIQTSTGDARPLIMKDGKEIPIGPEQFNLTDPLMLDREMIIPCCRVTAIDRVRGGILGIKNGRPVIKVGDIYDQISKEKGQPVALNGKGDVIYTCTDSKTFQSPRIRLNGKVYQFALSEWTTLAGNHYNDFGTGLPMVIDWNESGQVLFMAFPPNPEERGKRLYLATPSVSVVEPTVYAQLNFTVKSGNGKPLDAIKITSPATVSGAFSSGNLTLSITAPSKVSGKTRTLFALVNGTGQGQFVVDMAIPVTTTFLPTGMVTGSTSYSDLSTSLTAVATAGAFRVKSISLAGGFKVGLEDIQLKGNDGTIYLLNGEVIIMD